MAIDLHGNIKVVGSVYLTAVPARGKWLLSRGTANETAPPWRHGRGLVVRVSPRRGISLGRWWPTSEDQPGYLPGEWSPGAEAATTEEIKQWRRLGESPTLR